MDPYCNYYYLDVIFFLCYRQPLGVVPDPLVCELYGKEQINGFDKKKGNIATVLYLSLIKSKHTGQKDRVLERNQI